MYLQNVVFSQYSAAKGSSVDYLDPTATQHNFNAIAQDTDRIDSTINRIDSTINGLNDRLLRMEQFLDFCHRSHPEVLKEFLTVEHAKVRVGAVQAPPPPRTIDMDLQALELRTLAAIGKLP
jgi:hypothetical protein